MIGSSLNYLNTTVERDTTLSRFMQIGKAGERLVSSTLNKLGVKHRHNSFEDDYQYSCDEGGPDITTDEDEIEIKNLNDSSYQVSKLII